MQPPRFRVPGADLAARQAEGAVWQVKARPGWVVSAHCSSPNGHHGSGGSRHRVPLQRASPQPAWEVPASHVSTALES